MLLKDAVLATLDPPGVARADLRLEGERIAAREPSLLPEAGDETRHVLVRCICFCAVRGQQLAGSLDEEGGHVTPRPPPLAEEAVFTARASCARRLRRMARQCV